MKMAAYCRVSTGKAEQLDSLENQKAFFQEYAQRSGHQLVEIYADAGTSGVSLRRRDAFARLMRDAEKGLFELVAVKDVSRFARNTVDFLQSIRRLKRLGVNTLFLTANMDSLGESEFVLTLFSALAQEESANLSKRVKFGKKLNAQKGRVPSQVFGYDRIDAFHLAINPQEAETVREIYRLYAQEGLGCRTISQRLNAENRRTKTGCAWTPRGVRRVLENSIYCGDYVNNKCEVQDYLTGKRAPVPPEQRCHHPRPEWAIIPPALYEKAQALLTLRRIQYGAPNPQTRYSGRHAFSTLIQCASCGKSFCRKQYTYRATRVYWKCATNDQRTASACGNRVKLEEPALYEALRDWLAAAIPDQTAFLKNAVAEANRRRPRRRSTPAEKARDLLEARRLLSLETAANGDLRRLIERVIIHEDGLAEIRIRDLSLPK